VEWAEYERMHAVEDRMWWYRGLRTLVTSLLGRALSQTRAEGPVLDAGCGTGGMLKLLGDSIAARPTLGLEYNPEAALLATSKARRPVASGSVNEMPFGGGTLAGYVSLDVWCHAAVDPEKAVNEAWRCLQPGAVVVLNLPAYAWMLSAHDRRVHNARRFSRSQARVLLERSGFKVLRASYWNTILFPLMVVHRLLERDGAGSDVKEYPQWLDKLFAAALSVERAVIGAGLNLPFGGSLIVVAQKRA
jgi:SAM-dependent methyltransferase